MRLARMGKSLAIVVKERDERLQELLSRLDTATQVIELDLADVSKEQFSKSLNEVRVETVIHAACPPFASGLDCLMKVNFEALQTMFDSLLPDWLRIQNGCIIFVSSSATFYHPSELHAYTAAKSATANYVEGLSRRFSEFGIQTCNVVIGQVKTAFSNKLNLSGIRLMPEQVAEEIVNVYQDRTALYTWVEASGVRKGDVNFVSHEREVKKTPIASVGKAVESEVKERLVQHLRSFFGVNRQVVWESTGVDLLSGWDSLGHIELLLSIEKTFGIKFSSHEIVETTGYIGLQKLVEQKVSSL